MFFLQVISAKQGYYINFTGVSSFSHGKRRKQESFPHSRRPNSTHRNGNPTFFLCFSNISERALKHGEISGII